MIEINSKPFEFYNLEWDSEFFGVKSAKAILHKPLSYHEWTNLKDSFSTYQFVSIENRNSESINAQFIGKETTAYLVDVNIQFRKALEASFQIPPEITFHQALERNNEIVELADFGFSKFTEDPELAKRGGDQVYSQWLINSFDKPEKYFALSHDEQGMVNGFLLHSYSNEACVIELIAVSKATKKGGIGTELFKSVESNAFQKGYKQIKVGTQMKNMGAINFYQKLGCKQVECHQVYHQWNL